VPVQKLDTLVDKRDKLTSKIFEKKLENLFFIISENQVYEQKIHDVIWLDSLHDDLIKQGHLGNSTNVFSSVYPETKAGFLNFVQIV
jgi:hypothetical protein